MCKIWYALASVFSIGSAICCGGGCPKDVGFFGHALTKPSVDDNASTRLYIVGGAHYNNSVRTVLDDAWFFDLDRKLWRTSERLPISASAARMAPSLASTENGLLYLYGGGVAQPSSTNVVRWRGGVAAGSWVGAYTSSSLCVQNFAYFGLRIVVTWCDIPKE